MIEIKNNCFERNKKKEWLITNGLGGWASSTIYNLNTRKYHGILIAAIDPPLKRYLLVNKIDEEVIINENTELQKNIKLYTNQFDILTPDGYKYFNSFKEDILPEFRFTIPEEKILVKKTVFMIQEENTTIIKYTILNDKKIKIKILPLVNCRDIHHITRKNNVNWSLKVVPGGVNQNNYVKIDFYENSPKLLIGSDKLLFIKNEDWWYNFNYEIEKERGYEYIEDCFFPGYFEKEFEAGENTFYMYISASKSDEENEKSFFRNIFFLDKILETEIQRKKSLIKSFYENQKGLQNNEFLNTLINSSSNFIVKRNNFMSIIAGYHWFQDYGRDTFISLSPLLLEGRRYEDAKKIFLSFLKNLNQGLIPNFYNENNEPVYNSADATLWLFISLYEFYKKTKDLEFIKSILPKLEEIVEWYQKGTHNEIKVNELEFVSINSEGNYTWMDAKVNDIPVTSRRGCPVEIVSLWYNTLKIMDFFLKQCGKKGKYEKAARKCKKNFLKYFWNGKYLRDVVIFKDKKIEFDESIRPNQLIAIALPFDIVKKEVIEKVISVVEKELITEVGVRTLSIKDMKYKSHYIGNENERNAAYHNGAIWPFLLLYYVYALKKIKKLYPSLLKKTIDVFNEKIKEYGIGYIPELYDPENLTPAGCIGQAWSMGSILKIAILSQKN